MSVARAEGTPHVGNGEQDCTVLGWTAEIVILAGRRRAIYTLGQFFEPIRDRASRECSPPIPFIFREISHD